MLYRTIGVLALLGPNLAGCTSLGSSPTVEAPVASGSAVREDSRMTLAVLDQHCMAFGERYVNAFRNAIEQIKQNTTDQEIRALAHTHKLRTATSVYDILSGPSPFAKLMDLVLLVELQYRVWVTDNVAARDYGGTQAAEPLVAAITRERADVWRVADEVLKPNQRDVLKILIDEWRERNPDVEAVAAVRFSEFSEYRGKSILDGVPLGSGLLAPVSEATRQMEETRMLAERVVYLTKRMPELVRWQAEAFLNTALLHPEIRKLNDTAVRVGAALETLPDRVAEERAALMKRMEDREKAIGAIAQEIRLTAADAKETVKEIPPLLEELKGVLKAADSLAGKIAPANGATEPSKDSHPFDIREYTATVRELRELLESPVWTSRLSALNQTAQVRVTQASEEAGHLLNAMFWRATALIVLVFGLAIAYRTVRRRSPPRSQERG